MCLQDTHSLSTICNELEGCNFVCRFEITKSKLVGLSHGQNQGHMKKISILAKYLGSLHNIGLFNVLHASLESYRVKITKSKLVGLYSGQNQGHMQKISILA